MAEPKSSHKQRLGLLFNQELTTNLISTLFGVCLFTACRINEAYTLHVIDVYDTKARVRPYLIIRKGNTKGKLAIRTIPVITDLKALLSGYSLVKGQNYLFPGRYDGSHINPDSAARILRKACRRIWVRRSFNPQFSPHCPHKYE